MKYKATVYTKYESEIEAEKEAGAKMKAVSDMMIELQEFLHPKVKIVVTIEEISASPAGEAL